MLARNETIIKWGLYAAVSLLGALAQGVLGQSITLLGVIPFLFPLFAAIPATYEASAPGTAFALAVGVFCDLLLPAPLPCFYTLVFPLVGLFSALLSESILPAGYLCSAVASAFGFFLTGLFHIFLLWMDGKAPASAAFRTMVLEFLITLPAVFPMTAMYRWIYRKTHLDN